ncbi:MOZ/SAS family protein [Sarocladium implicatum]|nr:MOZ/SAS family protein [Sarocladium implicatum]
MSSARAAEDELQQSVMLSAEDAEYETADQGSDSVTNTRRPRSRGVNSNDRDHGSGSSLEDPEDGDSEDRDASGEEIYDDVDASGDEEIDLEPRPLANGAAEDEDSQGSESDEGEEDEAVGAVKTIGSASDDSDHDSDVSSHPSAAEEDSDEAPWEQDDEGGDDDEDSEAAQTNICLFCKQDEENDPSEDFEAFLSCKVCKVHAHQQCAREADAMAPDANDRSWACPECDAVAPKAEEEDDADVDMGEDDGPEVALGGETLNNSGQTGLRELSAESGSVIASRPRRKRKSPSPEVEDDGASTQKRRRNASSAPDSATDADAQSSGNHSRSQSRALRLKATRPTRVTIDKRSRTSLVLTIRLPSERLKKVLVSKRTLQRRAASAAIARQRLANATTEATPTPGIPALLETPFTADSYSQPFYSFFDKETDDAKGKPYGGILTEAEADTSKTLPQQEDRRRFDQAKQKAEDEWRERVLAMQAESEAPTRKSKKSDHASQIECIEFGGWEIDTWYAAPYPAEYSRNRVLYICEFCLKYMNSDYVAWRHKLKCGTKHPPGDEIYRHGSISFFEVDGRKNPVYCQNLCLLAKLFLGSKTLYYDVEPFLFYVLCEYDDNGYHFVGYFSKEKRASSQNNVSCILTLPIHQRKGYGNLLIDFSYLLTKVEEKTGSPEKPLSDMGLVSYRNYWRLILCRYFIKTLDKKDYKREGLSIKRISDDTGMTADDIISALEGLRALVRDPQTKTYAFRVDIEYCRQYVAKWEVKGYVQLEPKALAWTPYVMGRSNAVNFELGPPINTIAPREDDEAKIEEGPNSLVQQESKATSNGLSVAATQLENTLDVKADDPETEGLAEKVREDDKENATPRQTKVPDEDQEDHVDAWSLPYRNIPPSRFEVFPAVTHGRRNDRPRVSRPSAPRASSSSSRPKRPSGSARRSTLSRPKSSSSGSRRKSGGTGRGPGRWPKGTKKADYGNADSGPGLPPGWTPRQGQAQPLANGGDRDKGEGEDDESVQDEVRVFVGPMDIDNVNGATSKSQPEGALPITTDEVAVAEDVDAEGETE